VGRKTFLGPTPRAFPSFASRALLALPLTLAILGASSPAAAQPGPDECLRPGPGAPREIRLGGCVRSTIGPDDPKTSNGTPYEDWRLVLEDQQAIQIDMESVASGPSPAASFDTYLELRRAGEAEPLARNDDRPGSLNSRIVFPANAGGQYIVRARPLFRGGGGDYTLRIGSAPPPPVSLIDSGPIETSVGTDSPPGEMAGYHWRLFSFDGTSGERVRIDVEAGTPTVLMLLLDQNEVVVATTWAEGRRASLMTVLPRAGPYYLRVEVPVAAEPTSLKLNFDRRSEAARQRVPTRIAIGETISGELGLASSVSLIDPAGTGAAPSFSELFELPLRARETVTVRLESEAFDAVLDIGRMSPRGFVATASDDDSGGGFNARLVRRQRAAGSVYLRVRALGAGAGAFRLSVARGETPLPRE
jgi:hypothetical protein